MCGGHTAKVETFMDVCLSVSDSVSVESALFDHFRLEPNINWDCNQYVIQFMRL